MGGQTYTPVSFRFACPARQVYLLVHTPDTGSWSLNEMEPAGAGRWALTLPLPEGRCRVRYYADDGRRIVYSDPTDGSQVHMEGMDAILEVVGGRHPVDQATTRFTLGGRLTDAQNDSP